MDIVRFWRDVPHTLRGAALAIGNFDGVHRGHQAVLGEAIRIAKREGRRSGAVVFDPHPREFFVPGQSLFYLTPLPLKLELLEALGLDQTFVIPFDQALASLSAEAFTTDVIAAGLGASHVVVGHDFSYGKGRTGTTEELAALGRTLGFGVDVVSPVGARDSVISSILPATSMPRRSRRNSLPSSVRIRPSPRRRRWPSKCEWIPSRRAGC